MRIAKDGSNNRIGQERKMQFPLHAAPFYLQEVPISDGEIRWFESQNPAWIKFPLPSGEFTSVRNSTFGQNWMHRWDSNLYAVNSMRLKTCWHFELKLSCSKSGIQKCKNWHALEHTPESSCSTSSNALLAFSKITSSAVRTKYSRSSG